MNYLLEIQIDIFMIILLSIVLTHAIFKLNKKNYIDKMFISINVLTIFMLLLESLSVILSKFNQADYISLNKIINVLGFSLTPILPGMLLLITLNMFNKKKYMSKKKMVIFIAPLIFNIIMSVMSYNYNLIFNINDFNVYNRGPLFFLCPLISYSYTLVNFIVLIKNKSKFYHIEMLFSLFIILGPLIMGIIQIKYFIYLTIWNTTGIMVCVAYICILNAKIKIDPLTKVENRQAYEEYVYRFNKRESNNLVILNIDVNNFKQKNDTYGHSEGDKALIHFADTLSKIFDDIGRVMRTGGDEFTVFIDGRQDIDMKLYIKRLSSKLNDEESPLNYKLTFSYGVVKKSARGINIEDAIILADKLMYENKKASKK